MYLDNNDICIYLHENVSSSKVLVQELNLLKPSGKYRCIFYCVPEHGILLA